MNALYKHRLTQKWEPYAKKPILPVFNLTLKYFFFTPYEWIKVFGWFLVKSASVLSAISWADLLEVTCKQQATGSSRAWPTPKDDLSRSVLYLHYVSLSNSILILKRNFKYPGQLVNPIPTGCCHVTLIYRLIPPMAGRNRVKEDDLFRSVLNLHCVSFFDFYPCMNLLQSAIEKRSKTVHHSYHSKVKTTYLPT